MSSSKVQQELAIRDRTLFDNAAVKLVLRLFFRLAFRLRGWRLTPVAPEGAGVTIAAPHTSNWDIFYAFGAAVLHDIKIYFSIKESWCRVPVIGWIIRYMGAIPIDRSKNAFGQVEKIRRFVENNKHSRVFFLFTPEGTRSAVEKWKTGFYHVAENAELPIFLAKVDYRSKETGVFHTFQLTGDKDRDIAAIQASYASVHARFPDNQFPAYRGPLPTLSRLEERVISALYGAKGLATRAEIAARAKLDALSTEVLEFLVEQGILEKFVTMQGNEKLVSYQLTNRGNGFFLHMQQPLTVNC